jgi:hypothetical protein
VPPTQEYVWYDVTIYTIKCCKHQFQVLRAVVQEANFINYIGQKHKKVNNLKQKKDKQNKTKQIPNEQIEESNRLRYICHKGKLQTSIILIHVGI